MHSQILLPTNVTDEYVIFTGDKHHTAMLYSISPLQFSPVWTYLLNNLPNLSFDF